MRTDLAHGAKNLLSVQELAPARAHPQSERNLLPIRLGHKNHTVPGVSIERLNHHAIKTRLALLPCALSRVQTWR
jgi:hypothetical protein